MTKENIKSPASRHSSLNYIHFAFIGRPHGLKGAFFLKTEDRRQIWDGYKSIFIEMPQGLVQHKVKKNYLSGNALAIELENISTREEVEALYLKKLFVDASQIKLKENEYLVHDLLNYSVINSEKKLLGKIVGVVSYGAQENLENKITDTQKNILYPFIEK
jgi:16S rRNA processing protein RimM